MKDGMVVRYRFWYLSWTDEREENWLRAMAREGLHLVRAQSGIGRYVFRRGAPQDVVFSVEYRGHCSAVSSSAQDGWEPVPGSGGWSYWRKASASLAPGEMHVDPRERAAMLQRLLGIVVVCGMPMFINAVLFHRNLFDPAKYSSPVSHALGLCVYAGVAALWGAAVIRLAGRIHHYKRVAA